MRILITGGAGCLGSNIIERYFPQGYEICVLDNFATGKREVVPSQPGLTVVEGSVADADLVNTGQALGHQLESTVGNPLVSTASLPPRPQTHHGGQRPQTHVRLLR